VANKVWYDIDPMAGDLWVIEGPEGADIEKLKMLIFCGGFPNAFRWVEEEEWEANEQQKRIIVLD
jgi:hypothetical protein